MVPTRNACAITALSNGDLSSWALVIGRRERGLRKKCELFWSLCRYSWICMVDMVDGLTLASDMFLLELDMYCLLDLDCLFTVL